jgi:hypothetical protein
MIAKAQPVSRAFLGAVGVALVALGTFSLVRVDLVARFIARAEDSSGRRKPRFGR